MFNIQQAYFMRSCAGKKNRIRSYYTETYKTILDHIKTIFFPIRAYRAIKDYTKSIQGHTRLYWTLINHKVPNRTLKGNSGDEILH